MKASFELPAKRWQAFDEKTCGDDNATSAAAPTAVPLKAKVLTLPEYKDAEVSLQRETSSASTAYMSVATPTSSDEGDGGPRGADIGVDVVTAQERVDLASVLVPPPGWHSFSTASASEQLGLGWHSFSTASASEQLGLGPAERPNPLRVVDPGLPGVDVAGIKLVQPYSVQSLRELKSKFTLRQGDVFLVSHFPIRGLQCLLTCLVEGRLDPWADDVLDKPHWADMAASRRGVDNYLEEISRWHGRRCFKTHAFPHIFPCQYPLDWPEGEGVRPKIVVLVGDPRHMLNIWWEFVTEMYPSPFGSNVDRNISQAELIEAVVRRQFIFFGDMFEHAMAWAQEAAEHPDTVRLFPIERLGSLDPKEVLAALSDMAEFLEIPQESSYGLMSATFRKPSSGVGLLASPYMKSMTEAMQRGHLIEMPGPRQQLFEESFAQLSMNAQLEWRRVLCRWADSPSNCLADLAQMAGRGAASLLPNTLMQPGKGEALHAAGLCRPCLFALRGQCKETAEMCRFCHGEGHPRPKRASHKTRKLRKLQRSQRSRSPSPVHQPWDD